MSNNFCRFLSNGYRLVNINNQLMWHPCCRYSKATPLLNSEALKKSINYTSSAISWLPECDTCKKQEFNNSKLSLRKESFIRVPDNTADLDCVALELSIDMECNAACLSCSDTYSTTWRKYNNKHNIDNCSVALTNIDVRVKELFATIPLDKVRNILILGGEPFYSDTHLKILQQIQNVHPNLKTINLMYQTNGSIMPSAEIQNLWTLFNRVTLSVSIDGIGDRFFYLRWPLLWERVEENIKNLISSTDINFQIVYTANPLNVLYLDEVENWAIDTIPAHRTSLGQSRLVRINKCDGVIGLQNSSPELIDKVVSKYGPEHRISQLVQTFNFGSNRTEMLNYITKHDYLRQLNWRTVFPDVINCL